MSTSIESEVLFTVTNKEITFSNNQNNSCSTSNAENRPEDVEYERAESILAVMWKHGKLGAAYYKISEQQLYVLKEITDLPPEYVVLRSLYREINPNYIITMGSLSDLFTKCLITLINGEDTNDTSLMDSVQTKTLPSNLFLLPYKEYTFDTCEAKVYNISLPSEPDEADSPQKAVFLHSLIDFDCKLSVYTLGALIKFTEKHWAHLYPNINDNIRFLHINQISLIDHVFIDQKAFTGLEIFHKRSHDASFKHGPQYTNYEGLSIFKLLSQYCKSKLGLISLKNILSNPIKDIKELNNRLDFIEFALTPSVQEFIGSLEDCIKKVTDLTAIFRKVQYSRANGREWQTLYSTIYNTLFFNELSRPYRSSCHYLQLLDQNITEELYKLQKCINDVFDFTKPIERNRPKIKFGLDAELDAKELKKQDIAKNITAAAKFAVNRLPEYLNECSVVYVPEMGYLVAINKWESNCNRHQLEDHGFHFVFEVNAILHYKNAMCVELDQQLGDIHNDILAHENRIIQRLSSFVLKYNKNIREPVKVIALLDCLISISRVSKEKGYVRPHLNKAGIHDIRDGRHPLLELFGSDFVPNDYCSGGNYSCMKILTGPNSSGKSVYLKQIAIIIFLAHIGCYIPAKKANISMVYSIHSRIHATESAGVSLSAFMLDIVQMSQALHNAQKSSLVILDEFGRGTTGEEGFALLLGALRMFSNKGCCPHLLVSTHLQHLCNYLPEVNLTSHIKMDNQVIDSRLVFLYKVVKGISDSYPFEVASAVDVNKNVISRAWEIFKSLSNSNAQTLIINSEEDLTLINIPEFDD